MTLIDQIKTKIQAKPIDNNGNLVIQPSDFELDFVNSFFNKLLNVTSLTIAGANKESGNDFITVTGSADLLGYSNLTISITFKVQEDEVIAVVTGTFAKSEQITLPVISWIDVSNIVLTTTISETFELITYMFNMDILVQGSSNAISIELRSQPDSEWHLNIAEGTEQGITGEELVALLSGNALNSFLPQPLVSILNGFKINRIEAIFNTEQNTVSYFSTGISVTNGWDIAPRVSLKPGLQVNLTLISPTDANRRVVVGNVAATFDINGVEIPIMLGASIGSTTFWSFGIQPDKKVVLPSFSDLLGLAGGEEFLNTLPEGLSNIPQIEIDALLVEFDPSQSALQKLSFEIQTEASWAIIPGYFEMQSLLVEFDITNLTDSALRTIFGKVRSVFKIGPVPIMCSIEKTQQNPNWTIIAGLPQGTTVSITHIAASLFEDKLALPEDIPDISFSTLNIIVVPTNKSFSFNATSANSWQIISGLSIETFDLNFTRDPSKLNNPISGHINTSLMISTVTLNLSASINENLGGGWQFSGSTGQGQAIPIGHILDDLVIKFGLTDNSIPKSIKDLTVLNLAVTFNTQSKDFAFSIETKFPIDGKEVDAVIDIEITHNDGKYSRKFSGIIKVVDEEKEIDLEFDLIFKQDQDAETIFLAAFENKAGKDISIKPLVELITDDPEMLNTAEGISFDLKDALLVIDKGTDTKVLFGLDIGGGLDVSKLPLVGKMFPANSIMRVTFQPVLTSNDFSEADMKSVRPLVPSGGYQLPKEALERFGFSIQLLIGDEVVDLSFPIGVDNSNKPSKDNIPSTASTTSTNDAVVVPPTDGIKWFTVQKQLGPVNFGRVGIQYKDAQLFLLLDASLSLAGLTIALDGLYVSSTLNPIHPQFGLHGLGIDYKKGPLEIGAAFLRQTFNDPDGNPYDTYDGTAIIRTEEFALAAMGSYAYYQGHPSLFIYAFLDTPLGGPPFFFATGLAAGFGYNRRLIVPGIEGVKTFPLIAEVISDNSSKSSDPMAALNKLHAVIPPAVGEYFFAIGIRFSSFEIIDSFALLSVSFGLDFEIDVLGISTLVIPTPEASQVIEPLAEVQMALQAVFNPNKGYLKIRAALTSASFILSRNCHLTGGFAFYTWFKDNPEEKALAGDFVLSLGGYHPSYKPPPYYPKVTPLGFNWNVTSELVIKGDFYFALVPTAVMAGGHLSATWESGRLKAWFNIGADFIISWKPYFYDASMYLDMGVSYTYHFFGTHHISVDVGADLHIWGPEFSGKAHVHLWIVTFNVTFGAGSSKEPEAITWKAFREGFLPEYSSWVNASVTRGLIKKLDTQNGALLVVNPNDFTIETSSVLPVTVANKLDDEGNWQIIDMTDSNVDIYVGSMKIPDPDPNKDQSKVVNDHKISITNGTGNVTSQFTFVPIQKNVPSALWGKRFKHTANEPEDERMIKNACMGFSIKGKPIIPSPEAQTKEVDSDNLLNEYEHFNKAPEPKIEFGTATDLGETWLKSQGVREAIANEIEAKSAARDNLLKTLDFKETYYPNKELVDEFILS